MTERDNIIDLVTQVDMAFLKRTEPWNAFDKYEAFAALVRAPLQERIQDLYKQLNEAERELDSQYKLGAETEREACAKIAEYKLDNKGLTAPNSPKEWWNHACQNIRDAIRARGKK
jgi:hypothetical protein